MSTTNMWADLASQVSQTRAEFPRYPAYRDSGVAWLGKVPAHWELQRLKYSVRLRNEKVEASAGVVNYIGLENIEPRTGRLIVSETDIEPEGQSNRYHRGDVLFGKLRPYLAKVHLAEQAGLCTSELLVLEPGSLTSRFLFYWALSDQFIKLVDSSTYGAKMPRASWDFIGSLPSPVPPIAEQRAIVAFLDRETARIDALIAGGEAAGADRARRDAGARPARADEGERGGVAGGDPGALGSRATQAAGRCSDRCSERTRPGGREEDRGPLSPSGQCPGWLSRP